MRKTVPYYRVQLVKSADAAMRLPVVEIRNAEDAGRLFCEQIGNADREMVALLALDVNNVVIGATVVSVGTLDGAPLHPREVYKPAILLNAATIILGHNHTSGYLEPSDEDLAATKRLAQAGRIMGVELMDHIIVNADGQHLSLKQKLNGYWGC